MPEEKSISSCLRITQPSVAIGHPRCQCQAWAAEAEASPARLCQAPRLGGCDTLRLPLLPPGSSNEMPLGGVGQVVVSGR